MAPRFFYGLQFKLILAFSLVVIVALILPPAVAFMSWRDSYWWLLLVVPVMLIEWAVLTTIALNRRWISG